jgi:23S rRNA (cytosine1962-C5)-methyltransferase
MPLQNGFNAKTSNHSRKNAAAGLPISVTTALPASPQVWLRHALSARQRHVEVFKSTQAVRLLNGEYSETPGIALDWYAGHLIVFAYHPSVPEILVGVAEEWVLTLKALSLTLKDRTQKTDVGREKSRVLWGNPPESLWVTEDALRYRIELAHPFNVGLFLDTRLIRRELASRPAGRTLNLFSYTCSLGLAAAKGEGLGGENTVNVDVSKRYLAWGRDNYRENGFTMGPEAFRSMSAERYLDWALAKGKIFDTVILDPPSFARFEGQTFSLPRDYPRLAAKAAALIAPGGTLFAMTNYAGVDPITLRMWLSEALPTEAWMHSTWSPIHPDVDFAPPEIWRATEEGMLIGWRIHRGA